MKTTSSLESLNSILTRKVQKRGNFFEFLKTLQDTDFCTAEKLKNATDGVMDALPKKRKMQQTRENRLQSLTADFMGGNISLEYFFKCMTNRQNDILEWDLKLAKENEEFDASEVVEQDDLEDPDDNFGLNQMIDVLMCIICTEHPRDILISPCNHFKICEQCCTTLIEKSKNNKSELLCPYCSQIVKNNLKIVP